MNDIETEGPARNLVLEYTLDAPPEKVWQAISIPALRENWLPGGDLAHENPVTTVPGEEIRYRMRDEEPPFLESTVTFQVRPDADGGTILRIVHEPADVRLTPPAANDNGPWLMRAA